MANRVFEAFKTTDKIEFWFDDEIKNDFVDKIFSKHEKIKTALLSPWGCLCTVQHRAWHRLSRILIFVKMFGMLRQTPDMPWLCIKHQKHGQQSSRRVLDKRCARCQMVRTVPCTVHEHPVWEKMIARP